MIIHSPTFNEVKVTAAMYFVKRYFKNTYVLNTYVFKTLDNRK